MPEDLSPTLGAGRSFGARSLVFGAFLTRHKNAWFGSLARRGGGKKSGVKREMMSWCFCLANVQLVSFSLVSRSLMVLLRKEVIQPHVPVRLPCYDFTLLTGHSLGGSFLAVRPPAWRAPDSDGVTGGVYKARERIHRAMLMRDY